MEPLIPLGSLGRAISRLPTVASAALVAGAIVVAPDRPFVAVFMLLGAAATVLPSALARLRFRRLLLSGDVEQVQAAWRRSLQGVPRGEDAEPMMSAILFAAYGWVDEARAQLLRARLVPEAFSSREHLLFVETLVEAFDGDRGKALESAEAIASLPLPQVGSRLQRRVLMLRASLGALARAFAHRARSGDLELLESTAQTSPLVSWAMRYAAAVVAIDHNEPARARSLIAGAPVWPEQSAFRTFHSEIETLLPPESVSRPG